MSEEVYAESLTKERYSLLKLLIKRNAAFWFSGDFKNY
jgi:hypothetical protein